MVCNSSLKVHIQLEKNQFNSLDLKKTVSHKIYFICEITIQLIIRDKEIKNQLVHYV